MSTVSVPVDPGRRKLLLGAGAFIASSCLPLYAFGNSPRQPRLLTVLLRGGLDGLSTIIPFGDSEYTRHRGAENFRNHGQNHTLPLDGFFSLNPNMPHLGRMYQNGEARLFHAVASPYRRRSHFDAQDVLESGLDQPGNSDTGWMNRAIHLVASKPNQPKTAISVGAQIPVILRGPAPVSTWLPPGFVQAPVDTQARLLEMYEHTDPALAEALRSGIELDQMAGGEPGMRQMQRQMGLKGKGRKSNRALEQTGNAISQLMSAENGPRIGFVDIVGWDTHANQNSTAGRLGKLLGQLDHFLDNIRTGFGSAWQDTAVIVVTEFGRTVALNGTRGTDHGTGTVAFLLGGAVNGGTVIADWPGLREGDLHDKRDLKPTTDVRSIFSGVLSSHLGVSDSTIRNEIFPDRQKFPIFKGLTRN